MSAVVDDVLRRAVGARTHDALSGATTLLQMVARDMERIGEDGAHGYLVAWEDALHFIAQALHDEATEVWSFLHPHPAAKAGEPT